jgi:hypothetical protein
VGISFFSHQVNYSLICSRAGVKFEHLGLQASAGVIH